MSPRAWIAFAAVSTLWGIPYLFIKVAVEDGVPPAFLAWVLGVVCTAAAFAFYGALVAEAGAGRALVITNIAPVVVVALGVAVLGERPGAGAVAGLLLILAGSWLATGGRIPPGFGGRAWLTVAHGRQGGRGERGDAERRVRGT